MDAHENFVNKVRSQLQAQNASVRSAARRSGIPVRSLHSILNDGRVPSIKRAEEICAALGLEFYIGLPRTGSDATSQAAPDERNLTGNDQFGALAGKLDDISAKLSSTMAALAQSVDDEEPPGARPISVAEVQASAGGGSIVEMAEITGHAWFRRSWLDANAVDPGQSVIMKVKGESMEPILMDGASILVDRNRTRRRAGHIYVITTDHGLVAKRLGRNGSGGWQLESTHPEYTPFAWDDHFMEIIGEVRWTARTLRPQSRA